MGVRGVRTNPPSEGQGPRLGEYGAGPGRSPRRLLARYGAGNYFSSVGGTEQWKGKGRVARYSSIADPAKREGRTYRWSRPGEGAGVDCHAKIDHFWLPNLVRVAKSGPGFFNLHETSPCSVKFAYYGVLLNMIRGNKCVQ